VHGDAGRNRLYMRLLQRDELGDALAGLAFLRALPSVDAQTVAAVGHSFGGSLTLLLAERDSNLRAAVDFAGAAASWSSTPELRSRLLAAVAAVFILHAANDYSVAPAEPLASEMARLGKAHRMKIYPAVGTTAFEGHNFIQLATAAWEPDVFAFLDARMRPDAPATPK
jgi:dienelactone hydrolase